MVAPPLARRSRLAETLDRARQLLPSIEQRARQLGLAQLDERTEAFHLLADARRGRGDRRALAGVAVAQGANGGFSEVSSRSSWFVQASPPPASRRIPPALHHLVVAPSDLVDFKRSVTALGLRGVGAQLHDTPRIVLDLVPPRHPQL